MCAMIRFFLMLALTVSGDRVGEDGTNLATSQHQAPMTKISLHTLQQKEAVEDSDEEAMEHGEDEDEVMMKEAYANVDANGDQMVDMQEAKEAGFTELEFQAADANQDGSVDQVEFKAMADVDEEAMEEDEDEEAVEDAEDEDEEGFGVKDEDDEGDDAMDEEDEIAIKDLDANGDQMVDMQEAKEAGFTELEFQAADTNQDGSVDQNELTAALVELVEEEEEEDDEGDEEAEEEDEEDDDEIAFFNDLDANGDQMVDMQEAKEAGFTELEFQAADTNQDGSVDQNELTAALVELAEEEEDDEGDEEAEEDDEEDDDEIAFNDLDANGDQMVGMQEAKEAGFTELEFQAADTNQDGIVDQNELTAALVELVEEEEDDEGDEEAEEDDEEDDDEIGFNDLDADGDQMVDMQEAKEAGFTELEFQAADADHKPKNWKKYGKTKFWKKFLRKKAGKKGGKRGKRSRRGGAFW